MNSTTIIIVRTYAVERSKPPFRESSTCSSAIYRRWRPFPTPDESPMNPRYIGTPFREQAGGTGALLQIDLNPDEIGAELRKQKLTQAEENETTNKTEPKV